MAPDISCRNKQFTWAAFERHRDVHRVQKCLYLRQMHQIAKRSDCSLSTKRTQVTCRNPIIQGHHSDRHWGGLVPRLGLDSFYKAQIVHPVSIRDRSWAYRILGKDHRKFGRNKGPIDRGCQAQSCSIRLYGALSCTNQHDWLCRAARHRHAERQLCCDQQPWPVETRQ